MAGRRNVLTPGNRTIVHLSLLRYGWAGRTRERMKDLGRPGMGSAGLNYHLPLAQDVLSIAKEEFFFFRGVQLQCWELLPPLCLGVIPGDSQGTLWCQISNLGLWQYNALLGTCSAC